mmetsp:Transcript_5182/g.6031  ORF Transcript_5182/g.6031 Transcript_5182/m.6031 type:complete len:474 (-) Transcript_5182:495-1916(-)
MDDGDDLLASSDSDSADTDDLIQDAQMKPVAKKRLQKKSSISKKKKYPDADNDDDDDAPGRTLSKRERMDYLQKKKRKGRGIESKTDSSKSDDNKKSVESRRRERGYMSGDSYDSGEYVRTKEDDDFIDRDGDDEDAVNELYKEQHFDDDRPSEDEEMEVRKKKMSSSGRSSSSSRNYDRHTVRAHSDNPLDQAIERMKKKQKTKRKDHDMEVEANDLIKRMTKAAEDDVEAIKERRPATKKLRMLDEVVDILGQYDMIKILLEEGVLSACKLWIEPLPSGALGNVTIRKRIIETITNMGDKIEKDHLKRSRIGQSIMVLYKHKSETPSIKRELKVLIEKWSRPIFEKSNNMKRLSEAHQKREIQGLSSISATIRSQKAAAATTGKTEKRDLQSIIASGKTGARKGLNRVRVPQRKAFHFSIRPDSRLVPDSSKNSREENNRSNLSRRMIEKGRVAGKNQRSVNVSTQGRSVR